MKDKGKWKSYFNETVLCLGLVATLAWVLLLYHVFAAAEANRLRALGVAQLNWLEQSMGRQTRILDSTAAWVSMQGGKTEGFEKKAAVDLPFSHCAKNIQLIPLKGEQLVYPKVGRALDTEDDLELWAKDFMDNKRLTPLVLKNRDADELFLLRPVYLGKADGTVELWGFAALTVSMQSLYDEMNLGGFESIGVNHELYWQDASEEKQMVASRGDFSGDDIKVSRDISGVSWTIRLQPEGGWCDWWIVFLGLWSGLLPTVAVAFYRNSTILAKKSGSHDFLTGAYNRSGGEEAAEEYFQKNHNKRICVMALDIDNFKLVNDVYGHDAGDEVLKRLVEDIRAAFPWGLVIRNGGDEFMILQSYEKEHLIRERITLFANTPHYVDVRGEEIKFTTSLGAATYPAQDDTYLKLANKADFALYNAKLNGKADWRLFDDSLLNVQKRARLGFNLADLSDHMPGAMFVVRCDEQAKILFASTPTVELLGCESWEDFLDYSQGAFKNVVRSDDWKRLHDGARLLEKQGEGFSTMRFFTLRLITKSGETKEVFAVGKFSVNGFYGSVFYAIMFDKAHMEVSNLHLQNHE